MTTRPIHSDTSSSSSYPHDNDPTRYYNNSSREKDGRNSLDTSISYKRQRYQTHHSHNHNHHHHNEARRASGVRATRSTSDRYEYNVNNRHGNHVTNNADTNSDPATQRHRYRDRDRDRYRQQVYPAGSSNAVSASQSSSSASPCIDTTRLLEISRIPLTLIPSHRHDGRNGDSDESSQTPHTIKQYLLDTISKHATTDHRDNGKNDNNYDELIQQIHIVSLDESDRDLCVLVGLRSRLDAQQLLKNKHLYLPLLITPYPLASNATKSCDLALFAAKTPSSSSSAESGGHTTARKSTRNYVAHRMIASSLGIRLKQ